MGAVLELFLLLNKGRESKNLYINLILYIILN